MPAIDSAVVVQLGGTRRPGRRTEARASTVERMRNHCTWLQFSQQKLSGMCNHTMPHRTAPHLARYHRPQPSHCCPENNR